MLQAQSIPIYKVYTHEVDIVLMFTYLIPCKNNNELLEETLESIDIECADIKKILLVDDYSEVPINDSIKFQHPKLSIIRNQEESGIVGALNFGLKHVNTDYVLRLDSDDLDLPCRIKCTKEAINNFKDADIIAFGKLDFPGDRATNVHWRSRKELAALLTFGNPIYHPTVCIKTSVFKKIQYSNGLNRDGQAAKGAEDYLLWCKAYLAGFRMYNYPSIVIKYRVWDGQVSRERSAKDPAYTVAKWFQAHLDQQPILTLVDFIKSYWNNKGQLYGAGSGDFTITAVKRRFGNTKGVAAIFWCLVYLFIRFLK